ncbi:sialidase family protein [Pelomonas sp. Root1237]|uniref:sialidase family protein n=1 Tax=Pelomonas sp. Root1237 TaxID=1736434 RepID=UPI000A5687A9|nr:sialidase family protein [Pelomonas sp. Root1237]
MRLKLGTLMLALGAVAGSPALAQTCTPTAITPYVKVNGTWTQTASATIKTGASAILGPQPTSGGMWSWSGCGTAGASREQTIQPPAACTATATYTNSCGAKTQQAFSIKVGTWASAKFGGGGYVSGLVFHPTTANLLYARTDVGGAYRWNQGTSSWVPITDGLGFGAAEARYHGVESMAVDPNNDQLVYMATGMYVSEGNGRLYMSSNRGDTWTSAALPFPLGGNNPGRAIGERLMVDPNKPSTLFYGSRTAGLWKSTDSGLTWAQVTSLSTLKMTADQINANGGTAMGVETVVYDTSTKGSGSATQTIYAAVAPDYANAAGLGSSLYKSTNGGASWTPVTVPVAGYHIPHMARATDGMFYIAFTKDAGPGAGGPGRFYKFDGSNWTLLKSVDPIGGTNFGFGGVSVYGSGATTRIALGVTNSWGNWSGQQIVQLSDDAGRTWREIEAVTPGEVTAGWVDDVEIDPSNRDHILHVSGGGIVETRNASSATPTWGSTINGIEETAVLSLATPPAGATYAVVNSSGDVGTWLHTNLATKPTLTPGTGWSNGFAADMAWSDPQYVATIGYSHENGTGFGFWSGDGGKTWTKFATNAPGVATNTNQEASIAVTARNKAVWAPGNSVPSYTTDNGATWVPTNLPAINDIYSRGYHLAADRKNPNKVYAYDSGGNWWGTPGKVYVSTDGGRTFTLSQGSVNAGLAPNYFANTSLAVNPNVEGELWLADGNTVYRSTDSGATWAKLSNFASIFNGNQWAQVQGASVIALGKAKAGAPYSAAVYVVGVINGVWGVHRSEDAGATWTRFNDDAHQFGGIGVIAADQNIYGRIYFSGTGRGMLYSN